MLLKIWFICFGKLILFISGDQKNSHLCMNYLVHKPAHAPFSVPSNKELAFRVCKFFAMYRKEKPLILKSSASSLTNNLSVLVALDKGVLNYAVVHKAVVNIISASTDGATVNSRNIVCKEPSAAQQSTPMIIQVLFCVQHCISLIDVKECIFGSNFLQNRSCI